LAATGLHSFPVLASIIVTDLCDTKTMLVDSQNNVGTPRGSFVL
jgi:hypothetical protein